MKPNDLLDSDPTLEELRSKWIVFSDAHCKSLLQKQASGRSNFHIRPVSTTDGRWALKADVLTEIAEEKAVYKGLYQAISKAVFALAEIMDDADFNLVYEAENQALLPWPPEPEEPIV